MTEQTRRQFLQAMGIAACGTAAAAMGTRRCFAQAAAGDAAPSRPAPKDAGGALIPSYLGDQEALYRKDPRAAALQWLGDAKFGLFVHYSLYSLRRVTAKDASEKKSV